VTLQVYQQQNLLVKFTVEFIVGRIFCNLKDESLLLKHKTLRMGSA